MFDAVVISDLVGMRKPEPEIYLLTAERLGLPPQECLFVDDTERNLPCAADLGMGTVYFGGAAGEIAEIETHRHRLTTPLGVPSVLRPGPRDRFRCPACLAKRRGTVMPGQHRRLCVCQTRRLRQLLTGGGVLLRRTGTTADPPPGTRTAATSSAAHLRHPPASTALFASLPSQRKPDGGLRPPGRSRVVSLLEGTLHNVLASTPGIVILTCTAPPLRARPAARKAVRSRASVQPPPPCQIRRFCRRGATGLRSISPWTSRGCEVHRCTVKNGLTVQRRTCHSGRSAPKRRQPDAA